MNKVIILLGQRVRSGTNFVGSTLFNHPEVVTLPVTASLGEFNLFVDDAIIEKIFNKVTKKSFALGLSDIHLDFFLQQYGLCWLNILVKKFNIPKDKIIFIKSPIIDHLDLWRKTFPTSKIAIIYRDGRDNVISCVKASNDKRTWHNMELRFKKKINYSTGRSFVNHAKHWGMTARDILDIREDSTVEKFKYEDLNNSAIDIAKLLKHYDLAIDESIIEMCLNAPVVGSSFGIDTKYISKPNWKPDYDKSKFIFMNKWKKWGFLKKIIFKKIAGKELIELGYENNNNW